VGEVTTRGETSASLQEKRSYADELNSVAYASGDVSTMRCGQCYACSTTVVLNPLCSHTAQMQFIFDLVPPRLSFRSY
jgi:hypothetical protein